MYPDSPENATLTVPETKLEAVKINNLYFSYPGKARTAVLVIPEYLVRIWALYPAARAIVSAQRISAWYFSNSISFII